MGLKSWISETAPEPIATLLRDGYYAVSNEPDPRRLRREWKRRQDGYDEIVAELTSARWFQEMRQTIEELTNSGEIGVKSAYDIYYLVRSREPDRIVETGVANGMSSAVVLAAIDRNGHGELHSIDLPFRADVPYEARQQQTFEGIGHAEIPSDKDPGWLIPDRFRDDWTFYEGKSQTRLPAVMAESPPDLFIHDSEHSHPCMMFEFELAWHHMEEGVIFADDIDWNSAFDVFTDVRADESYQISRSNGYVVVS